MNKELEQNIERIEKELAKMKAKLEKSKKFEWFYPYEKTFALDTNSIDINCLGNSTNLLQHGRYRLSKQYAEASLERNRVANRLEALVEQIEPDYVVPENCNETWFVFINKENRYNSGNHTFVRHLGQVYMNKETANKICELLNSGEVVL